MPLSVGDQLGPYVILAPIGAGGMGEVYKARDTRLDRIVALKIAKSEFGERFDREARAVAALNHPHICHLYDVGPNYLVMEYVEGEPLKGPLPLDQALKYAAQICEALDAAHRKGITHRDLKPANILVTKSAGVKLLDFGLAKVEAPVSDGLGTMTMALTGKGQILGTLQYMSPEQVNGQEAGAQSDIFSFGLVLYEMLTGRPALEGSTPASIIAAILERPAPSITDVAPASVDRVLKSCLEKDPENRWQSVRDLKVALQLAGVQSGMAISTAPAKRNWLWPSAAVALLIALALLSLLHFRETPPRADSVRFTIPPPADAAIVSGPPWGPPLAVSPDGRSIVFVAAGKDRKRRLWVRPLDALAALPLAGTEDASAPFWSPDSQWVSFFANRKLLRVTASGGEVQTLCQCQSGGAGGTWNQDNVILFAPAVAGHTGLFRVAAAGGTPAAVTTVDKAHGQANNLWPEFLPDGHHFLYSTGGDLTGVYLGDLNSPNSIRLMPLTESSKLSYVSPGYILYVRERVLFAQPFDAKRRVLAGDPIRVVEGVETGGPGSAAFSVSSNGVLAYWSGAPPRSEQLTWVRRDGTRIATVGPPGAYFHFSLAPDEQHVALTRYETGDNNFQSAIWILDAVRGTLAKLTFERGGSGMSVWSPDNGRIVFASGRHGPPTLFQKRIGDLGPDQLLVKGGDNHPTDWSPDGRTIVYESLDDKTRNDLWLLSPDGHKSPFLQSPSNETGGRISPDSKWMAYASDESGRDEIYVTSYPERHGATRISTDGGAQAEWRRDGKELFYRAPDRKLMAVPVKSAANFAAGTPHALFELQPEPPAWIQSGVDQRVYAPSADGQRFLIAVPVGQESFAPITVVLNWTAGLKRN